MSTLQPGDRILIICDTTDGKPPHQKDRHSHVHGVDRTVMNMVKMLEKTGFKVKLIHPYLPQFIRFKLPMYPDLELALNPFGHVKKMLLGFKPNAIFNMTAEAPLGMYTSYICKNMPQNNGTPPLPYTAQFHTNMDDYASLYMNRVTGGALNLQPDWFHPILQFLYQDAELVLVPTASMDKKIHSIGIKRTRLWQRGVDIEMFRPPKEGEENPYSRYDWYKNNPLPVLLYFGRVAEEKNIDSFLKEKVRANTYHRVVIGEGPVRKQLEEQFGSRPDIHFIGKKTGEELAKLVRFATLHVFPSLTDTFGNTVIEAGASGVPTIAYAAPGPKDTILNGKNGLLVPQGKPLLADLSSAIAIDRTECARYTSDHFSLDTAVGILIKSLKRISWDQ